MLILPCQFKISKTKSGVWTPHTAYNYNSTYVFFVLFLDFLCSILSYLDNVPRIHDEIITCRLNVIHVHQITLMAAQESFIRQFFFQIIQLASGHETAVICRKYAANSRLTLNIFNVLICDTIQFSFSLNC